MKASDQEGIGTSSKGATKPFLLATSGFVTGLLILIAFIAESAAPAPNLTQSNFLTSHFVATQNDLALWAFRSYAWSLFAVAAIVFFALIGARLRSRSVEGAMAATLLSAVGVTLYVLRAILQDAGYAAAGTIVAPSATEAAYQAALFNDVANPLLPLGGAIWGLGFILFGILGRKSGILPNWLSYVAFVGGVAGWAIFPVLNTFGEFVGYGITELLVPFMTAVWSFGCGAVFLRLGRVKPLGEAASHSGGD